MLTRRNLIPSASLTLLMLPATANAASAPAAEPVPAPAAEPASAPEGADAADPAAPSADASAGVQLDAGGLDTAAAASGDAPDTSGDAPDADSDPDSATAWIDRYPPLGTEFEVGVFGGIYLPTERHELYEVTGRAPDDGYKEYNALAPDFGARVGFFPIRFLGIEAEGTLMPAKTTSDDSAMLWRVGGSLVVQIPRWSLVPFALAGAGPIGVTSDADSVGSDVDTFVHLGVGLKANITRRFQVRLDVRDVFNTDRAQESGGDFIAFRNHNLEAVLGVGFRFGGPREETPADADGDGIADADDKCVDVPGVLEYQGCPVPDTDGDGVPDPQDKCVDVAGSPDYEGCPIPDTDGDGILDPDDKCVDVAGVPEYEGCPIPDTDGDGILDPDDKCVDEPESKNGFQDDDGCPDKLPDAVKQFTGVIEGIYFRSGKADIQKKSNATLNKAVNVLKEYPSLRMEVSGHTDTNGKRDYNVDLSRRRAEAISKYLTDNGIDAGRIEIRAAGPDQPIDTNRTAAGRKMNRRIEFKILQ